mgnify:CR=1 FL=1
MGQRTLIKDKRIPYWALMRTGLRRTTRRYITDCQMVSRIGTIGYHYRSSASASPSMEPIKGLRPRFFLTKILAIDEQQQSASEASLTRLSPNGGLNQPWVDAGVRAGLGPHLLMVRNLDFLFSNQGSSPCGVK